MPVGVGSRLGRYVVQEYVGQGAFGPVYRGFDPAVGSVAVKVLSALSAPAALDRFRVVAPQLVTLRHPNLASVLDYGEHEGAPYLIVEYVAGGTLADRMRSPAISQLGVVAVLQGAAAGIDHAHRSGFVHGALGPRQILLGPDDHPFVTDFGLAPLRREAGDQLAEPAELAYLAPEQVASGTTTAASDRYALAAVTYRLLTGRAPFDDFADSREALLTLDPPPPSRRNAALGPATDAVLLRGLAREPGARWQTGTQMIEALAEALGRDGTRVAAATAAAAPAAPRRSPWPWIVGAVVVAALVIAAVLLWLANQPKTPGITLSSSIVRAGDPVTVSANHLPANQVGTIELQSASVQIGTFQADQYGNAQQQVTIPASTSPGDHLVSLCWNGGCPASARVAVTERPTPTPSPTPTPTPTPVPTPLGTPTPAPTAPPTSPRTSPTA